MFRMFNRTRKQFVSLLFVFALLFGLASAPASASVVNQVHYLALGDSLAAGMTPQKGISDGYSDFAAAYFKEQSMLGSYSKAFAVPGYKTQNVLDDLLSKAELQEAVKHANLITISAGANDLLKEAKIDRATQTITLDPATVPLTLQTISKNYMSILQKIKELNPEATVYVMGYYFAFPYISDAQKPTLIQLTHTLNDTIAKTAASQGAVFVPVFEKFGNDPKQYLPNPEDIHPNAEGYQLMSDALLEEFAKAHPAATDIKGHWAEKDLQMLVAAKLLPLDEKGKVYPNKTITRAEVASIIYSSIPTTQSVPPNPGFKDVPETHPAYMAIAKLTEMGIFAKAKSFNPDAPLTRIQLAKVASSAFLLKAEGPIIDYKDVPATYWGYPYVQAVASHKIMLGFKDGTFGLHKETTRAQFAAVAVRAMNLSK
jgi:lysophospholipase L1-like esterase